MRTVCLGPVRVPTRLSHTLKNAFKLVASLDLPGLAS